MSVRCGTHFFIHSRILWISKSQHSMDIENDRVLEIANLSFDEPELEAILFDLEGNASL